MQNSKQNLSEFNSEKEITELSRFIVIKSLEETPLIKLLPLLIKKKKKKKKKKEESPAKQAETEEN